MAQHSDSAPGADDRRVHTTEPAAQPLAESAGREQAPAGVLAAQLAGTAARGGDPGPGTAGLSLQRRHAHLLGDPRLGQPVNAQRQADLFLQLQRTYGNRHVQAVVGLLQTSPAGPAVQRDPDPAKPEPQLLQDFAKSFADSADIIRKSPTAMKLVQEAAAANVKFGGFAEDGPGKSAWPYTAGDTVYVPKAHTDKVTAMDDFLFELNNAIRQPAFAKLQSEAAKGSKGTLTAKDYAYKVVEQEVEGMLRMGEVWFETKKTMGGGKALDKYDAENYLAEYNDYKAGKKTKDAIIKSVLARTYAEGASKGKTVEQNYMDQYQSISGGK